MREDLALQTMCEMSSVMAGEVWREGSLRVTVADESGLTLMTLDHSATSAPAVASPARPAEKAST